MFFENSNETFKAVRKNKRKCIRITMHRLITNFVLMKYVFM